MPNFGLIINPTVLLCLILVIAIYATTLISTGVRRQRLAIAESNYNVALLREDLILIRTELTTLLKEQNQASNKQLKAAVYTLKFWKNLQQLATENKIALKIRLTDQDEAINQPDVSTVQELDRLFYSNAISPEEAAQRRADADDFLTQINEVTFLRSPHAGVFYTYPSDGPPRYVKEGEIIHPGQVVARIKTEDGRSHPVEADISGEILEFLVISGIEVEIGQPLIRIRRTTNDLCNH